MNKSSTERLKRFHKELVELEVAQADVKENISKTEFEIALQKTKKVKKSSPIKPPGSLITSYFKKDPQLEAKREAQSIILGIINNAWNIIADRFGFAHEALMSRHGVEAVQNFTAFNRARIMKNFWIPYYAKNAYPGSLLTFDNHSSHVCDATSSVLNDYNINHLNLPANATPICQPVDIQIGADLKAKMKNYFENWLIENEEQLITYDPRKKRYRLKSPNKGLILQWVLQAYQEIDRRNIMRSRFNMLLLN